MYAFEYHRPQSLADAAKLLAGASEAKLLAGGHTLIPTMKQRLANPPVLIDLARVAELRGIDKKGNALVIGAMTHARRGRRTRPWCGAPSPACARWPASIGDPHVRNRGTIGGSVANNDPAADYPAALLALGATIATNKREIKADDFFKGMFSTALGDGEIITRISFPVPAKFAYVKFANPASRYALVGVAVAQTSGGAARGGDGRRQQRRLPPQGDGGGARQGLVGAVAGGSRHQCRRHDERHARRCRLPRAPRRRAGAARGGEGGVGSG